ncbi:unnamed protein product [Microthlaspi erraticum]|uniref:Uncharacterized protein n=1 Tax=Microthlaspi erraticum TaxID=1685480 RepID=A0A6D2I6D7_9BRAS|nr:unnamed protein product [Microthlaspi erraticum]
MKLTPRYPDELLFQCRWKYAIWISHLGDITFVLKTGPQPAERTRPDRKGIGFARPSPGRIRPGRQWTTIDRDITSRPTDRATREHRVDPISANKKPTYAVLTILSPINLNRLVKT